MSNQNSNFNAATGKGAQAVFKQVAIYSLEALKAVALFIKHLLSTFVGK